MDEKGPCWPWCKEFLKTFMQQEISRIEAILEEREKATMLLAQSQLEKQASAMSERFVLLETHRVELLKIQEQITGPLGMELRMRNVEQARGSMDAKMYLILLGLPVVVSAAVALFMLHVVPK